MIRAFFISLIAGLIAVAGLAALPGRAQEGPPCAQVADVLASLATRYAEAPRVAGLTSSGAMMLITANAEGGFSVLLISPDGTACMVASGVALEVHPAPVAGVDG